MSTQASPLRILVVEDHAVNQMVARLILQNEGYAVEVAGDGIEAVEACGKNHYDLVLMDLHMPGLDGFDATREIRKFSPKNLNIVAVTADVMSGVQKLCTDAGMNGYLSKPYTMDQLLEVTRTFASA